MGREGGGRREEEEGGRREREAKKGGEPKPDERGVQYIDPLIKDTPND